MAGAWLRFLAVLPLALALALPASAQPSGPAVWLQNLTAGVQSDTWNAHTWYWK